MKKAKRRKRMRTYASEQVPSDMRLIVATLRFLADRLERIMGITPTHPPKP